VFPLRIVPAYGQIFAAFQCLQHSLVGQLLVSRRRVRRLILWSEQLVAQGQVLRDRGAVPERYGAVRDLPLPSLKTVAVTAQAMSLAAAT